MIGWVALHVKSDHIKPQTSLMVIVTGIFQNPVADQENIGLMDNFLFLTTFLLGRNKLLSPLWISKK